MSSSYSQGLYGSTISALRATARTRAAASKSHDGVICILLTQYLALVWVVPIDSQALMIIAVPVYEYDPDDHMW